MTTMRTLVSATLEQGETVLAAPVVAEGQSKLSMTGRADRAGPENRNRLFTPATLARQWACSERHVRNLIAAGELRAFRLGGKLLRIPADAIEEFMQRNRTDADGSID